MTFSSFTKIAVGAVVAGASLGACSGGLQREPGLTPLSMQRVLALTVPHYHAGFVRPDRGTSWMKPNASKALLYDDDDGSNDVYVYDYPSGKLVGTLTGFDYPYGECIDQKGDVYISNFDNGKLVEYAHGGTSPINTYTDSGGYLIGCSISPKGDVAATAFETSSGYGNVCIWKGGTGSPTCIDGSSSINCYSLWTFGYDHKGDLIGEGENSGISECMIPAGGSSIEQLSASGITIDFAAGTQWDGEYVALGDQEADGQSVTGVWPATLSGSTISAAGSEIILKDRHCSTGGPTIANPFFFGKQNVTSASTKRANRIAGPNLCNLPTFIDVWKYPATAHDPILRIPLRPATLTYGVAVSTKE